MFTFDELGNLVEVRADGSKHIVKTVAELSAKFKTEMTDVERQAVIDQERTRVTEIKRCCELAKIDPKSYVEGKMTVEQARSAIFAEMEVRAKAESSSNHNPSVQVGTKNKEMRRTLMTDAILARGLENKKGIVIHNDASMFRGLSLIRMAQEVLRNEGVDTSLMGEREIAKRAMNTSSDFPLILQDAINKSVRAAYAQQVQTFEPIATKRSARDFKKLHSLQLDGAISLEEIPESGEYEQATLAESEESYKVKKYGKKLKISEEVIINDDLRLLTRVPQFYGESARRLEGDLIWSQITANGNMSDSVALFHATHKNLASASAISIASIGELRKLMRLQIGLDAKKVMNLPLRYLLVPAELETIAQQFLTQITPNDSAKVNPFPGLGLIVEPRLDVSSTSKWYGAAGKDQCESVEWAVLEGMENGPEILSYVDNDYDGMVTKIKYTIAAKAVDHRGLVRNG